MAQAFASDNVAFWPNFALGPTTALPPKPALRSVTGIRPLEASKTVVPYFRNTSTPDVD
jgi:hypothetical protein